MSPVAVGLDLLLAVLLVAALVVGLRLNARLKALRDGQAAFVKAVAELDAAATRTQAGLAALRAGGDEAHDALLKRIETARALTARLEAATQAAEKAARSAPELTPARPSPPVQAALGRGEARLEPRVRPEAPPISPPAMSALLRRAPARAVDEDLFATDAPDLDQPPASPARRGLGQRR